MFKNILIFYLFFVIKDSLEQIKSKKSKFYFQNFLGKIVGHNQAKHRKDRMKTEGAYFIWKDWRTDRWMTDGSASDKLHWLCHQRS